MYYNFLPVVRRKPAIVLLSLALIFLFNSAANAQHRQTGYLTYGGGSNGGGDSEWGIRFSGGYDVPQGDLGSTFKAAPTFEFSVIRNLGNFTFNTTIGYQSYKPKQDTVWQDPTDHTQGYDHYSSLSTLKIFAGAAYNFSFSDAAKFYIGLNIGSYYNFFNFDSTDGVGDEVAGNSSGEASYLAPKLGLNFSLNDNISIGIEGRYNFTFQSSSGSGDAYDAGYATTTTRSFSGHVALNYNF